MKKYLNNIRTLAALLMAGAAFTACSSDDNIIGEQPAQGTKTYTMTINASKGGDATTRALSLEGKTLNATWATTENVYVKKGDTWAGGSLQPEAAGATATLKGTLTGITPASSDVLTLQFPRSGERDYSGQLGTLADIAAKYDYATATVTVASVSASGNIVPTAATTTFENQQSIVKFTLKDKGNSDAAINATQLVVNDGTTDYTINPASETSEIYAAIPGFSGQTVTLTATVGGDTYTYQKTGVTFENGQYYEISVKMTKAAGPTYPVALSAVTADYVGSVVTTDGNVYATVANATAAGKTAAAMIAYVDGTGTSLAIALADEGKMNWATAKSTCEGKDAIGGNSWKLPTQGEWNLMFSANGGNEGSCSGLNSAITNAGGTALQEGVYWSSSEEEDVDAYAVACYSGSTEWYGHPKEMPFVNVRACLAFTVESSAGPTYPLLSAATTADYGKVVCAAGHLHDAKTAVPDGCTAVGILGKVTVTGHGLILALQGAANQTWNTIDGWTSETTYAGTTLLTGGQARCEVLTQKSKEHRNFSDALYLFKVHKRNLLCSSWLL